MNRPSCLKRYGKFRLGDSCWLMVLVAVVLMLVKFGVVRAAGPRGASEGLNVSAADDKETIRINRFCRRYLSTLLAGIDEARGRLQEITAAADTAAERIVAGGDLYIASVRTDFTSEGVVRSGGLMLLKPYRSEAHLSEKDTVILGWTNSTPGKDLALVRQLRKTGAFLVGIGPKPPEKTPKAFLSSVDLLAEQLVSDTLESCRAF